MRFNGEWRRCDDGDLRPVIRAEIQDAAGNWQTIEFLVDTGADRTVVAYTVLQVLNLQVDRSEHVIGGIGGIVEIVTVNSTLRLTRDDGETVTFRGTYAAFTQPDALELSILGRDILNLFTLILNRKQLLVAMIGGNHSYSIHP